MLFIKIEYVIQYNIIYKILNLKIEDISASVLHLKIYLYYYS